MQAMADLHEDLGGVLKDLGLRSTPQRRAIIGAFRGGVSEHLSADEIHALASRALPDLGRGTVYATLAEFTELGLLAAVGAAEPVRYETNTAGHHHFRCRLCLRLFDVDQADSDEPRDLAMPAGFEVERIETRAEGICADCTAYEKGLRHGTRRIGAKGALPDPLPDGLACAEIDGPLGAMLLAASSDGLVRVAFDHHGDAEELRARSKGGRGSQAARKQLGRAADGLRDYLTGSTNEVDCAFDWNGISAGEAGTLLATRTIPYGGHRSYTAVDSELTPHDIGVIMGANPVPIATPCHRVTRGVEIPPAFVGGTERRHWLDQHERQHAN
jgi:Fe2+ or Zn2+ uptake regulation protein/O6-methylguanine-DNA--protein-cysteine methyltransferase